MKIYRIARSSIVLDMLEEALPLVIDKGEWKTLRKSKLMAGGYLDEYGVIELAASDIKFENDRYYIKIFYMIYNDSRGKNIPLGVPVYRGFVEGFRETVWGKEEEVGTHKDIYGPFSKLVDLSHPDRKDMVRIGDFENFVGNYTDVANNIKATIDRWGNDSDFDVEEISPAPVGVGVDLVRAY